MASERKLEASNVSSNVISNEKLLKITRMSIISETIQKDADAGLVVFFELLPTNSPGLLFAGHPGK